MPVVKRGERFHYRFMVRGVSYSGPCTGCVTQSQAEKFETEKRRFVLRQSEAIRTNKTVTALVENYRKELSGGKDVSIEEALDLAAAKPSRHEAGENYASLRRTYWGDFVAFLKATFPDVKYLSNIRRSHCEAYVKRLVDEGRFVQELRSDCKGGLSPKTVKEYASACKWVMLRLEEDAGIIHNPWTGVVLPAPAPIARDIFTMDELRTIWEGLARDTFCLPLFVIAANSGMTEGDICTLKWSEIDFAGRMIRRDRRKTGAEIILPIIPELAAYLSTLPRTGEYVLPEHAERYLKRRTSVPGKVKRFLESLGIKTTVSRDGIRNVSVKDLHSLRHIFCYRAKRAGIPEDLIAKMVGHKIVEMTRHYADHDTENDLRLEIQKLPALFVGERGADETAEDSIRRRLAELAYSLPLERVQQILRGFEPPVELPKLPE